MPVDQFAELRPGDRLAGLYTRPWNKFLELVKPDLAGDPRTGRGPTSVEVLVNNSTGASLDAYSVLGLAALNKYADDPDGWDAWHVFDGTAPTAGSAVAVTLDALGPGELGRAVVVGRVVCQVNLTALSHRYAWPVAGDTTQFKSAAAGPVYLVGTASNWTATGQQWAIGILLPTPAAATFARFALAANLATSDASQAGCTVDGFFGGPDPGATITVYNLPTHTAGTYMFSGSATYKGLAAWDSGGSKWWIVQLECSGTGGGGGGGGFTGTIGN